MFPGSSNGNVSINLEIYITIIVATCHLEMSTNVICCLYILPFLFRGHHTAPDGVARRQVQRMLVLRLPLRGRNLWKLGIEQ